jgi:hypothetical protein
LGAEHGQGTKNNFLFKNQYNVLFTDISGSAGVQDPMGRGRTPIWFDFNEDGNSNMDDVTYFMEQILDMPASAASVPEPSSLVLVLSLLAMCCRLRSQS